jgi:hypothetical protein
VPVLAFSVGLALITGILFGLFPALQLAHPEIGQMMQSGTRTTTGDIRGKRLYTAVIAGQIALTLVLLTAAGASMEGFLRTLRTPLGYNPLHVVSVGIPVPEKLIHDLGKPKQLF